MRRARIVGFVIGGCALVIGMWASTRSDAQNSNVSGSGVKWEYAQLYVGDGKIVWMEANHEATITPPTDRPPENGFHSGPNTGRYVVNSKATRNSTVGVLNLFGNAGWEVVSNTPWGSGTLILLKRPC